MKESIFFIGEKRSFVFGLSSLVQVYMDAAQEGRELVSERMAERME